jgi:hypothetical protein
MAFSPMYGLSEVQAQVIRDSPEPSLALLVFLCRPTRNSFLWMYDLPIQLELVCHRSGENCVVCPQSACLVWCLHTYQFGLPPACISRQQVLTCRSFVAANILYAVRKGDHPSSLFFKFMRFMSFPEYARLCDEITFLKRRLEEIGPTNLFRFSWHKTLDLYPRACHEAIKEIVVDWKALYAALYEGSGYTDNGLVPLRTLTGPVGKHHGLRPIRSRLVAYLAASVLRRERVMEEVVF